MPRRLLPVPEDIAAAAALLGAGGLVAFPTETVYGLGADATSPEAVAKIYAAKGRPAFNPLIAHVADRAAAEREGQFSDRARALADAFWPGPLTLVVPLAEGAMVCDLARAGLASVGLRVPAHPAALDLLRAFGRPVAGPSANRSGHVSPTTADHVITDLGTRVDAVLDGGAAKCGIESTILGCLGPDVFLLRPGLITRADILSRTGIIVTDAAADDDAAPVSPGRLSAHYAPSVPVRLDARDLRAGEALLAFGPVEAIAGSAGAHAIRNLSPSGDLVEAAANLYRHLRELDATRPAGIAVAPLLAGGLGEALADRLGRAAAAGAFK